MKTQVNREDTYRRLVLAAPQLPCPPADQRALGLEPQLGVTVRDALITFDHRRSQACHTHDCKPACPRENTLGTSPCLCWCHL